jgi:hypothetical protein
MMNSGAPDAQVRMTKYRGSCLHCFSLDTGLRKDRAVVCRDCGCVFKDDQILQHGMVDLDYSMQVLGETGATLWVDTLNVLFSAQRNVAAGLKIKPGSSFTKWLKSKERTEGIIDDAETILTLEKISRKILKNRQFIFDPYILGAVENLADCLPAATKLVLTFKKR